MTGSSSHLGISGGLYFHNGATLADSRFMSFYPTVQSLYLYPGSDFATRGLYKEDFFRFDPNIIFNETYRKLLNISGINYYTLRMEKSIFTIDSYADIISKHRILPNDIENLKSSVPGKLNTSSYIILKDSRSFGMAYIAKAIYYKDIKNQEEVMRKYHKLDSKEISAHPEKLNEYKITVQQLQNELVGLKEKHSVVVEEKIESFYDSDSFLQIYSIKGNKAAFKVDCKNPKCLVVFNNANIKGWEAYSNSTRLKIKRVNFGFMGVEVDKGEQIVWFEYRRISELVSLVISLVTIIFSLLLYIKFNNLPSLKKSKI
jgi:hypothetical protein